MRTILSILLVCLLHSGFAQVDTIVWEKKASLPDSIQRVGSAFLLIDSDFYVAGGQIGNNNSSTNTVWQYHIPTDQWHRKGNLPFGASTADGASFVLNGKGYFLTARDSISNYECDRMLWEYNPVNDSWFKKADFPDSARQNSSYFVYQNKGYVGQTNGCTSRDTHFWQYDPTIDKWSQIATVPSYIIAGSLAIPMPSANAYLLGGYDIGGNFQHDVWRYDIITDLWDSIGQMPGLGRCFSSFWGFDSVIIGGGGQTSDNDSIFHLGSDFYRYDVSRNLWTPVVFENSFDSTGAGGAFVYNKRGYYFGGYKSLLPLITLSNDMWSFDASRFFPDTTTGIAEVKNDASLILYPNPVSRDRGFSISTSESGEVVFYDELGRTLDERKLIRGITSIKLTTDDEVVFYRASLQDGTTQNGKVVLMR